ncbi:hypothetical protein PMAYCL1PPCAC_27525, partial [Pristionchus mayeri]
IPPMQLLYLFLFLIVLPFVDASRIRRNPLDCFVVSSGHALLGAAFAAPRVPNLQACMRQCLRRNKCRSLLYYHSKNVCVLNSKTRDEKKSGFVSTEGLAESSDYYERTCNEKTSPHRSRPVARAANTAKECFTIESGKVLIGIVDQQIKNVKNVEKCMKACQDSKRKSSRVCKSAMYYEKEQECILASQNKADSPDLFIEDENSMYLENSCFSDGEATTTAAAETTTESPITTTTTATPMQETTPEVEVEDVTTGFSSTGGELVSYEPPSTTATTPTTTTTTSSTPKFPDHIVLPDLLPLPPLTREPPPVEESGYVIAPEYTVTKSMAATKKSEIIPPHMVDSYGVHPTVDEKKPQKANKSEHAKLHRRKLRHQAIKECFSEISAVDPGTMTGRVVKAYSMEQCIDICRLCNRCLRRKPCLTVAYHEAAYSCGLSSEPAEAEPKLTEPVKRDILFFSRGQC